MLQNAVDDGIGKTPRVKPILTQRGLVRKTRFLHGPPRTHVAGIDVRFHAMQLHMLESKPQSGANGFGHVALVPIGGSKLVTDFRTIMRLVPLPKTHCTHERRIVAARDPPANPQMLTKVVKNNLQTLLRRFDRPVGIPTQVPNNIGIRSMTGDHVNVGRFELPQQKAWSFQHGKRIEAVHGRDDGTRRSSKKSTGEEIRDLGRHKIQPSNDEQHMNNLQGTAWKHFGTWATVLFLGACNTTSSAQADQGKVIAAEPPHRPSPAPPALDTHRPAHTTTRKRNLEEGYPWFDKTNETIPHPEATLDERFSTPQGFSRVHLEKHSFGAFLRHLPLAAANTPVRSYRGDVIRSGDHPNVAAVVAIDVGNRDLQQCADAILRLHAEWRYAEGHRDHAYRAADGTKLSFARFAAGDRLRVEGNKLSFVHNARAAEPTHALLRTWLDDVFGWANTGALARDGARVSWKNLRPGDFFVLTGVPYGHAVLVLDMATDAQGRRALLLGQSFVPAQNMHVLRPDTSSAWFVVDESETSVSTPFWEPFPFESLRRLPE